MRTRVIETKQNSTNPFRNWLCDFYTYLKDKVSKMNKACFKVIPRFCILHLCTISARALTKCRLFLNGLVCEGQIIESFLEDESRDLTSIASLSLNTAIAFFLHSEYGWIIGGLKHWVLEHVKSLSSKYGGALSWNAHQIVPWYWYITSLVVLFA